MDLHYRLYAAGSVIVVDFYKPKKKTRRRTFIHHEDLIIFHSKIDANGHILPVYLLLLKLFSFSISLIVWVFSL